MTLNTRKSKRGIRSLREGRFAYPAGNIYNLRRQAYQTGSDPSDMDSLAYHYWYESSPGIWDTYTYDPVSHAYSYTGYTGPLAPRLATNRLAHVDDALGAQVSATWNDLGDQGPGNYEYDSLGRLKHDDAEGLDIEWTAYQKVGVVHKGGTTTGADPSAGSGQAPIIYGGACPELSG